MLITQLIHLFVQVFTAHGAHHVQHHVNDAAHGWLATKHYFVAICHFTHAIAAHHTYHCNATFTR
jgi:hypothetical protein